MTPTAAKFTTLQKSILIVDDDIDFTESIQNTLEMRGYQIEISHTGDNLAELVQNFSPEVALLDIRIGSKSGIDILKELKIHWPDIICIMMTAYSDIDNTIQALNEGAFNYLKKPIDP